MMLAVLVPTILMTGIGIVYLAVASSSSAGHTSSVLNRLENSMSCHRSERASPGAFTS